MSQTETTRQSDEILPPIAGSIVCLPVTNSLLIVDLTTMPQTAALPQSTVKGSEHTNPLGQYLTLIADAACNVAFAAGANRAAAVTNLGSLSTSATSTISGSTGAITLAGTETIALTAGVPMHLRMPPGPTTNSTTGLTVAWGALSNARWLGVIAGSNTTLRMWVSSR